MAADQPEYHPRFETAFTHEIAVVQARWEAKEARRSTQEAFDPNSLRGLALSGGGIRSASFCMGVIQQLHVAGVIDRLHYMSSVSGGGYAASSLTWFMAQKADSQGQKFGTEATNFPFCGGEGAAVRNAAQTQAGITSAPVDGRAVLDYIRQRSSYLNPGAGFTVISAIAIVLRSLLISVLGFVLLLAAAFLPLLYFGLFDHGVADFVTLPWPLSLLGRLHWASFVAVLAAGFFAVTIVVYSLLTGVPGLASFAYALRRGYQNFAGKLLGLSLALLLIELLMILIDYVATRGLPVVGHNLMALGGASAGAGAGGGLITKALQNVPKGLLTRIVLVLLPPVALLLLLTGFGVLAHELAAVALGWPRWAWLLGIALVFCTYTNINLTGLHRFYRDRLMETFMPEPKAILADGQAAKSSADDCNLADFCKAEHDGPYHLINAHVVLLGAHHARQRSRGGDSFVLSPLFCGSEATGFINTRDWLPGPASLSIARRHGPLALPTAMAISGAALNPRAGADGQGATKGGTVSALLNLLNLRLGYWVPSPIKAIGVPGPSYRSPPNFIFPGLVQGLFGFRHNEDAGWLELSDGGHFENTGIYELVRRGVRTIIFADGSTDPDTALSSFANALEKIYIDFNVRITFDDKADFIQLLKGTDPLSDSLSQRLNFSAAGFAIGTIHYPDVGGNPTPKGRLFYVKSTMIRKLPTALYSYKATNPLFPAESLADQFFSEQQFEAYRALGFALTKEMMAFADADRANNPPIGYAGSLGI